MVEVRVVAIGDGSPGPVTSRLKERFAEISAGRDPAFEHWLTPAGDAPAGSGR